jgi:transposase
MAAISMDLRVRIFEARQEGETTAEVAERFAVSPAFVRRLLQQHRDTGALAPPGGRRGPQPRLAGREPDLRRLHAERPDLYPAEIAARLGLAVSPLTVWRMLRRLGLSYKKSRSTPPSRTGPTSGRRVNAGRSRSSSSAPGG